MTVKGSNCLPYHFANVSLVAQQTLILCDTVREKLDSDNGQVVEVILQLGTKNGVHQLTLYFNFVRSITTTSCMTHQREHWQLELQLTEANIIFTKDNIFHRLVPNTQHFGISFQLCMKLSLYRIVLPRHPPRTKTDIGTKSKKLAGRGG